jgi:DNA-binding MarR family transcriptional regulator
MSNLDYIFDEHQPVRQDSKIRRQLAMTIATRMKSERKSNAEIAEELEKNGLVNRQGQRYSEKWVETLIRKSMEELAEERKEYGKIAQIGIENDLQRLIEHWMPVALAGTDPVNLKAADFVRKTEQDLALLTGANEPERKKVEIKFEQTLEQFIPALRKFMSESAFDELISAIAKAEEEAKVYWHNKKMLDDGNTIDAEVIDG